MQRTSAAQSSSPRPAAFSPTRAPATDGYCFGLPTGPEDHKQKPGVYDSAYAQIMGRTAYEGMAGALPTVGYPYSGIMNTARKDVFSRTLNTAEWANTTTTAGDTTQETGKLRRGGDGHIVVWGGAGLRQSLMRLDLTGEFGLDLGPYVAGRHPAVRRRARVLATRPALQHRV